MINSVTNIIRWRYLTRWLLGAISLLYVLSRFVPCGPIQYYAGIDGSWIQALHVAFLGHWQFGREIVFTYGPWGFLYGGFDPATHLISVSVWTILSVIFWCAAWRVARLCFNDELLAWFWLMAFSAVAGLTLAMNIDGRLIAWILLLLLLHYFTEDSSFSVTQFSLVVSLGLLSLVKFTIFIIGGMAVLVIATDTIWRQRRFPWILPVFGSSLLFFWEMAGQCLSSFKPFLFSSWRITSSYTEAMSLNGTTETRDVFLFLATSAMLLAFAGYAAWRRLRFWGILPLIGLGFVGFTVFKSGYVRQDVHEAWAALQLLLAALTCQAMLWSLAQKERRLTLLSTLLPTLVVLLLTSVNFARYSETKFLPVLAQTFSLRNIMAPLGLFHEREHQLEAHQAYLAEVREQSPTPKIEGSVDLYSYNQLAIFAHGLRYHPRPVIQSYSAYTPELAELNAAYLRSTNAPENILFAITPIDSHYPPLEDGRSWPELLTRYDIKDTNGPFLLLTRSANPRKYQKIVLKEADISFGKPLILSTLGDGPIWAEIEINKSLLGTIISTLYKPPVLLLAASLRDGRQGSFRLIPGMTRSGFLLSPYIYDQKSFVLLASHDESSALANLEVTSVTISVAGESGESACYQSPIRVRLYRLDYPRQNLGKIENESASSLNKSASPKQAN